MKTPHLKLIPQSPLRLGFLLIPLTLGCFALSPTARAVTSAPDGCVPDQYIITPGTDQIVPGTIDIGNHTDDGDTFISLPFPFTLYGNTYNNVNVSSNGRLDFVCVNEPLGFRTACLPAPANQCPYDQTIFGVWQDMRTDFGLSGCSRLPGGTCGIFTSVTGTAPDRIFNIEWRTVLYLDERVSENFEVRLYENSALNRFDVVIGTLEQRPCPHVCVLQGPWVSGVQGPNSVFTQDFCIGDLGTLPQNVSSTYTIQPCGLTLTSAASRRTQGGQIFDINLPLSGTSGVEPRSGANEFIIFTFSNNVTSVDGTTSSCGTVVSTTIDSSDVHNVIVQSNGACNQQDVILTLNGVHDDQGNTLTSAAVTVGVLYGDVDGDRRITRADQDQIKAHRGQTVDGSNFLNDINCSGVIDANDLLAVRNQRGHRLP